MVEETDDRQPIDGLDIMTGGEELKLMDKDKAYDIVSAYANEQEGELAEAMRSVLWRSQMDYEYIEGLLTHFCKCGCVANGIWEEGTFLHKHVLYNDIQYKDEYAGSCRFCGLE